MEFSQEISRVSRLCMPMCQRTVNTDISEDMTIPDYYPEIRRVLCLSEALPSPAAFVGGGRVELSGVADYTLIYVSGDGQLCSAPLSAEYSLQLPLENISEFELSEGVTVMAHSNADSSTVRLMAPRRLQLRSHVSTTVSAWGKRDCAGEELGVESPEAIQRLMAECSCAEVVCESSDPITLEDEYRLPEGARIAHARGNVVIRNASSDGEAIRISGELIVRMLIMKDGEERAESVTRRIKLEAETELDGVSVDSGAPVRVDGEVTQLDLGVESEDGSVSIKADVVLRVCAVTERTVEYTRDLYSTKQSCRVKTVQRRLPVLMANGRGEASISQRISLGELGIPEDAQVIDSLGRVVLSGLGQEDGQGYIEGECICSVIYRSEGEISCCEVRCPVKYELDSDGEVESLDATGETVELKARLEGDSLELDGQIAVCYTALGSKTVEMLESAELGEELPATVGQWTVCYVTDGDDSWSIAKRYRVRPEDIKGDPSTDRLVMIER